MRTVLGAYEPILDRDIRYLFGSADSINLVACSSLIAHVQHTECPPARAENGRGGWHLDVIQSITWTFAHAIWKSMYRNQSSFVQERSSEHIGA